MSKKGICAFGGGKYNKTEILKPGVTRMKRFLLLLWFLFGGWFIFSCPAAIKTVTVLQTSDLHCHFDPPTVVRLGAIAAGETARAGGRDHVLLLDGGDLIQGTFAATAGKGAVAVDFVNLLGYDLWTPGNHDFDFGFDVLAARFRQFKGAVAAANLEAPGVKPYVIFRRNGVKIAVIGLTFPTLWRDLMPGEPPFRLEPFDTALARTIPAVMREKPDIIILNVHYGISMSFADPHNSLTAVAGSYPQINLICGGHTHQVVAGRNIGFGVWYAEPGKHGEGISVTELTFDTDAGRVTDAVTRFVTEPDNAKFVVPESFSAQLRHYRELENTVIGQTSAPITGSVRGVGSPLQNLYGQALAAAGGTDYALVSPSLREPVTLNGPVTEGRLFAVAPYDDMVYVIEVTAEELRQIVAEQLSWKVIPQRQLPWGFYADCNNRGKLIGLRLPSNPARCRVAVSGFILKRGQAWFPVLAATKSVTDTGITIREALRRYLNAHSPVAPDFTEWVTKP